MRKGTYKHTPERIEKIRLANIGRVKSDETCKRLSIARKKYLASPAGQLYLKTRVNPGNKGKTWHLSDEVKARLAEMRKLNPNKGSTGKRWKLTPETRAKQGEAKKKTWTVEARKKMSDRQKGEKSHWWKGGVSTKNNLARQSLEYQLWREAVFRRDGYTCVWCKQGGGRLNADHIKPFSLFPELRFDVDNGRALCKTCHKLTSSYGSRSFGLTREDFRVDDFMVDCCE